MGLKIGNYRKVISTFGLLSLGILMLSISSGVKALEATTSYTQYSDTNCKDGVCITRLYSGIRYVKEDGVWKSVEDARSLKDSGFGVTYLEKDPYMVIDVIDFNYSSITVSLNNKNSLSLNNIPFTIYSPNYTKSILELTGNYTKDYKILSTQKFNFLSILDKKILTIPFSFGYIMKLGDGSTSIILNETNNGNLADTFDNSGLPSTNYGSSGALDIDTFISNNQRSYLIFNLSTISASSIINASLGIYLDSWGSSARYVTAYNTSNNWGELTLNWNNHPSLSSLQDNISVTGINQYWYWNVTNAVISKYQNATNKNVSIVLKDDVEGNDNNYYFIGRSKEHATTSTRPQMIIFYYTGDIIPPKYSSNSTNRTTSYAGNPVTHNLWWYDETALSGYIFSFNNCTTNFVNDTWINFGGGVWSNVTKGTNSTPCVISWCVYVNDSSNNWNETSCSNPFSYLTTATTPQPIPDWLTITIGELPITSEFCIDNDTLYIEKSGMFSINSNSTTITENFSRNCANGCDNMTKSCNPNPFDVALQFIEGAVIVAIIIGVLLYLYRRSGF